MPKNKIPERSTDEEIAQQMALDKARIALIREQEDLTGSDFIASFSDPRLRFVSTTHLDLVARGAINADEVPRFARALVAVPHTALQLCEHISYLAGREDSTGIEREVVRSLRAHLMAALLREGHGKEFVKLALGLMPMRPKYLTQMLQELYGRGAAPGPEFWKIARYKGGRGPLVWEVYFFASVDHDPVLIKKLWERIRTDMKELHVDQLTFLHVLCQTDAPNALTFFLEKWKVDFDTASFLLEDAFRHTPATEHILKVDQSLGLDRKVSLASGTAIFHYWLRVCVQQLDAPTEEAMVKQVEQFFDDRVDHLAQFDMSFSQLFAPLCSRTVLSQMASWIQVKNEPHPNLAAHLSVIQELVIQKALDAQQSHATEEAAPKSSGFRI